MNLELARVSPFRPVDWRYRRATTCREAGLYLSRFYDDDETKTLSLFLRRLQACRSVRDQRALRIENQSLWYAVDIYNEQDRILRTIIEARLLAGESNKTIGLKVGVTAEIVARYASFFLPRPEQAHGGISSMLLC